MLHQFALIFFIVGPSFVSAQTDCGLRSHLIESIKNLKQTLNSHKVVQCIEQEFTDPLLDMFQLQGFVLNLCDQSPECKLYLQNRVAEIAKVHPSKYEKLPVAFLWGEMTRFSGFYRTPPIQLSDLPLKEDAVGLFEKMKLEKLSSRTLNESEAQSVACAGIAAITEVVNPFTKVKGIKSIVSTAGNVLKEAGKAVSVADVAKLKELVSAQLPELAGPLKALMTDPKFVQNPAFWENVESFLKSGQLNPKTLANLTVKHGPHTSRSVPILSQLNSEQAEKALKTSGFAKKSETAGGYVQWTHADGSVIWIRNNGEVVRLSPEMKSPQGKSFRARYNERGELTESHNTGEMIQPK